MQSKDITRVAIFVAIAAISAVIVRYGGESIVPFSLLPLVAVLAGTILGPKLGFFSMMAYLVLGLIGIPIFSKPPYGGPAYLFQPTFGFLLGFLAAAFISGMIISKITEPRYIHFLIAMISGLASIYMIGIPYLYIIVNFVLGKEISWLGVIEVGFLPFIIFDLIKVSIGAIIANTLIQRLKVIGVTD